MAQALKFQGTQPILKGIEHWRQFVKVKKSVVFWNQYCLQGIRVNKYPEIRAFIFPHIFSLKKYNRIGQIF